MHTHPLDQAAEALRELQLKPGQHSWSDLAQTAILAFLMAQKPEVVAMAVYGKLSAAWDQTERAADVKAVLAGLIQQVEPDPEGRTLDQIAADVSEGRFQSMHELLKGQGTEGQDRESYTDTQDREHYTSHQGEYITDEDVRNAAKGFAEPPPSAPETPADGQTLSQRLGANAAEQCALAREVERLEGMYKAAMEGDFREVYLLRAGPDYAKGGFEVVLRSSGAVFIVEAMAELLTSQDATNFVSFDGTHPKYGPLSFTVQRQNGETPTDQLKRMKQVLRQCASTFRHYYGLHAKKGTVEGDQKAQANLAMAELCEQAVGPA